MRYNMRYNMLQSSELGEQAKLLSNQFERYVQIHYNVF